MTKIPDTLELEPEEIDAATSWHGGQSSMLYAVASTGSLSRGTIRPMGDDDQPMTDDEVRWEKSHELRIQRSET